MTSSRPAVVLLYLIADPLAQPGVVRRGRASGLDQVGRVRLGRLAGPDVEDARTRLSNGLEHRERDGLVQAAPTPR